MSVLPRIRKLLALAANRDPAGVHEAASAEQLACALLQKHGLRREDVVEATARADIAWDPTREALARAVALSLGVSARGSERSGICLSGIEAQATRAAALYRALLAHGVRGASGCPFEADREPAFRDAWLACYWLSYAAVLAERLDAVRARARVAEQAVTEAEMDAAIAAGPPNPAEAQARAAVRAIERLLADAPDLLLVEVVRAIAREAGERAGETADLDAGRDVLRLTDEREDEPPLRHPPELLPRGRAGPRRPRRGPEGAGADA